MESRRLSRFSAPSGRTSGPRLKYYGLRNTLSAMIRSFRDKDAEALFAGEVRRRLRAVGRPAQRKLEQLHAATRLEDLRVFPGNRLEALKGSRRGRHSIRINERLRICFVWRNGDAYDVEIVDYH